MIGRVLIVASICACFTLVLPAYSVNSEAGLFRRCDGSARRPLLTLVAAVAERRSAAGRPVLFPRLAAAAQSASGGSCGSCSSYETVSGSCGCTTCADCNCSTAARTAYPDCKECREFEGVEAAKNKAGLRIMSIALRAFASEHGDARLGSAVNRLLSHEGKLAEFKLAIQDQLGELPDNVLKWLNLLWSNSDKIVAMILLIASI